MKLAKSKECRTRMQGVSLIELVIALAIVGILSAIALPAYNHYVQRQQLREVQLHLLSLQAFQASFRLTHARYADTNDLPVFSGTRYQVKAQNVSATGFEIIAQFSGDEKEPACRQLSINHLSERSPEGCW